MKKLIILSFLLLITQVVFSRQSSGIMIVHYIDIGQADVTLLEFECGVVLIDAGAQVGSNRNRDRSTEKLMNYLEGFFERRTDLNGVISTIIITHNHNDHTESLDEIGDKYVVKNIVTSENNLSNKSDARKLINKEPGIDHKFLTYEDAINKIPNGLFYHQIDPLNCNDFGPIIKIYTGKVEVNQETTVNGTRFFPSNFRNPNNHSLVIRVEYGEASFIFTGDLQEEGIEYLIANYQRHHDIFESDVYQVGHHGSHNATNRELLQLIQPKIAVISAGFSGDRGGGTAWDHGHPNKGVVDMIDNWTSMENRTSPVNRWVFDGQESTPVGISIDKKLYCTCWENNVAITADPVTGEMWVSTSP